MPRTGRPRAFNRDEAVLAAMFLFWEHGFESTSLAQLRAAMGHISAASFYAAFESKEALFRETVERYKATYGRVMESFHDQRLAPKAAIEQGLRRSARMQTEGSHPLGCLVVLSGISCSPENQHIQEMLAKEREKTGTGLRTALNGQLRMVSCPTRSMFPCWCLCSTPFSLAYRRRRETVSRSNKLMQLSLS